MRSDKYSLTDLSTAFFRAISENADSKYVKRQGNKILFNGFWRNGDKQNICAWLDKATWHDAKTGVGGGCKEFAKIAFGLELPDFLMRFGQTIRTNDYIPRRDINHRSIKGGQIIDVQKIWQCLINSDVGQQDAASQWFSEIRGFSTPRQIVGSGFANLDSSKINLFDSSHKHFLEQRLKIGQQIVIPIRSTQSDNVQNLFFRTISNVSKEEKSRLLPNAGGWNDHDGSPRAFGFPSLVSEFPNLVICEGMADYVAAEYLLYGDEKYLPLGAPSASFLPKWADWLKRSNYRGRVIWIYQLDVDDSGNIIADATGQRFAIQAAKILREADIHSLLFNWPLFLKAIPNVHIIPRDLADVYSITRVDHHLLSNAFYTIYTRC